MHNDKSHNTVTKQDSTEKASRTRSSTSCRSSAGLSERNCNFTTKTGFAITHYFDSVALSPVKKISKVFRPVFENSHGKQGSTKSLVGEGVQIVQKLFLNFLQEIARTAGSSGLKSANLHRKLNRDGFAAARFLLTASRCHLSKKFRKYFDQFLEMDAKTSFNELTQKDSTEKVSRLYRNPFLNLVQDCSESAECPGAEVANSHNAVNKEGFGAARFFPIVSRCHLSKNFRNYFAHFWKMDSKKSHNKVTKKESTDKASKLHRNPFLNFLQEFRKKNLGLTSQEVIQKAAEIWRKMTDSEKAPYCEMAKRAPKRRKRGGRRGHRYSKHSGYRSRSMYRSRSRSSR
jgi:hypothetical protein